MPDATDALLTDADLVYAATVRCPCGAGMAHPVDADMRGAWDCSAILKGTAARDVKHEAQLPFVFYAVKSENQPSAGGATTRPDGAAPARPRGPVLIGEFGAALDVLRSGRRVARAGWNGKGMWLQIVGASEWTFTNGRHDNMPLLPFIGMLTAQGDFVPWLASQTDLLATDWWTV